MFSFKDIIGQEPAKQRLITRSAGRTYPPRTTLLWPCRSRKTPIGTCLCPLHLLSQPDGNRCLRYLSLLREMEQAGAPGRTLRIPYRQECQREKGSLRRLYHQLAAPAAEQPLLRTESLAERDGCQNGQAIIYAKESDEITRKLSLKSSEGGYKVTIVWLPEKMHEVCANKLLKLLEEPPEKTIFLLISEAPEIDTAHHPQPHATLQHPQD